MQIWLRFQGNARFTKIIHPGKPGWNVGMRIFQPALPSYWPAQTGISASGTARLLIKKNRNLTKKDRSRQSRPACLARLARLI